MKKIILLILIFISINAYGQRAFSYCKYIKGYWGEWQNSVSYSSGEVLQGTYDEFIIYYKTYHPSEYILKVKINGLVIESSKKEKARMKAAIKANTWYQYSGTVEYFTTSNTDFKQQFALWPNGVIAPKATDTDARSNIRPATITIQPFKKNPQVYNIWFDGYGIGIQLR